MQVVILGVFLQSAGGDFGCFSPDLMLVVNRANIMVWIIVWSDQDLHCLHDN